MVFERLKAAVRQLRSFSTFSRKEWKFGQTFEKREAREEELLQRIEEETLRAKGHSYQHAEDVNVMLTRGVGDIAQLRRRQDEMVKSLRQLVTNECDLMRNNFDMTFDLLEEFSNVLDVLRARLKERERSMQWRMNPLGSASEREEYTTLIHTLEQEFDQLIKSIEEVKAFIQSDLDNLDNSFRTLKTRLTSADVFFVNKSALGQIVQSDQQRTNVHLRDIATFRAKVQSHIRDVKRVLEHSNFQVAGIAHQEGSNQALRECHESISAFHDAFFELVEEIRKTATVEYHMLETELGQMIALHDRMQQDIEELDRSQRDASDARAQQQRDNIRRNLTDTVALLKRNVGSISSGIRGVSANLRRDTGVTTVRRKLWTATAALLLVAMGTGAMRPGGATIGSTNGPGTKENIIVAVDPGASADAQKKAQMLQSYLDRNPILCVYEAPGFLSSSRVADFVSYAKATVGSVNAKHVKVTITVHGSASPDHRPGREVQNKQLAEDRALELGALLEREFQGTNVHIEIPDDAGTVAPLPHDSGGKEVSLDEVNDVARHIDITHQAPRSDRERAIAQYLKETRRSTLNVALTNIETTKEIFTTKQLPTTTPYIIPPLVTMPVGNDINLPRLESVDNVRNHGTGSDKSFLSRDYARDFNIDARNATLKAAQTVRKLMLREEYTLFDSAYGLRLLRNEWNPIQFANAFNAVIREADGARAFKLVQVYRQQTGEAMGNVEQAIQQHGAAGHSGNVRQRNG